MLRHRCVLPFAVLMLAACSDSDSPNVDSPTGPTMPPVGNGGASVTLGQGQIELSSSDFNRLVVLNHTTPATLQATQGAVLTVSLFDSSRPGQTCAQDHPLSGCATVDWSDANQVFDNRIAIPTTAGTRVYFLSETRLLADAPDAQSDT